MVMMASPTGTAELQLRDRLCDVVSHVTGGSQPTLLSVSAPTETRDPLDVFARAGALSRERTYWEKPADDMAIAGAGVAWSIESARPGEVDRAWRELMCRAVVVDTLGCHSAGATGGPLLLGGLAFDPRRAATPLWDGFPAGRFVLPRVSMSTAHGVSTLTVNVVVEPHMDAEAVATRLCAWVDRLLPSPSPLTEPLPGVSTRDVLPRDRWEALVAEAAQACAAGRMDKVVLARAVQAHLSHPVEPEQVLDRLRRAYPGAYTFAVARGEGYFLGATPERLARLRDGVADVACLAGSAPRAADEDDDDCIGRALLASTKDRAEHQVVVDAVRAALDEVCRDVRIPAAPRLLRLPNVQHLYTPAQGRVEGATSVLDLVGRLHPTPAVGGRPREEALRFIRAREGLDRGWYAGPVGWLDRRGEGEFAVALRSALLCGDRATLFAGCGIVAGSDPAREYAETLLKLRPVLTALGAS